MMATYQTIGPRTARDNELSQNRLLRLLQLPHHALIYVEDLGHDWHWSQCQPLCQADVHDTIALVQLDPDERLILRGIDDIVARVIWEYGSVTGTEVEGTSCR